MTFFRLLIGIFMKISPEKSTFDFGKYHEFGVKLTFYRWKKVLDFSHNQFSFYFLSFIIVTIFLVLFHEYALIEFSKPTITRIIRSCISSKLYYHRQPSAQFQSLLHSSFLLQVTLLPSFDAPVVVWHHEAPPKHCDQQRPSWQP